MSTQSKRELRARLCTARASLPAGERVRTDSLIAQRVQELSAWREAPLVYTYLSFGAEVDTRQLIRAAWDSRKVVALPWCVPHTREMRWFAVDSLEGLVRSRLGVEEPIPDPAREVEALGSADSVALVPALNFDTCGFRLGYGGGFYDTFLSAFDGMSVGLCRHCQLVDHLPCLEPHDLPVDMVVTEQETIAGRSHAGAR